MDSTEFVFNSVEHHGIRFLYKLMRIVEAFEHRSRDCVQQLHWAVDVENECPKNRKYDAIWCREHAIPER